MKRVAAAVFRARELRGLLLGRLVITF